MSVICMHLACTVAGSLGPVDGLLTFAIHLTMFHFYVTSKQRPCLKNVILKEHCRKSYSAHGFKSLAFFFAFSFCHKKMFEWEKAILVLELKAFCFWYLWAKSGKNLERNGRLFFVSFQCENCVVVIFFERIRNVFISLDKNSFQRTT